MEENPLQQPDRYLIRVRQRTQADVAEPATTKQHRGGRMPATLRRDDERLEPATGRIGRLAVRRWPGLWSATRIRPAARWSAARIRRPGRVRAGGARRGRARPA